MTTENNDRPPLTSISTNGTYRLKLIKPKFEKVKVWEDGTASCRLFFVDDKGFCLSKNFSSKYGKALAMLVGKFSGKFTNEIRLDATQAEFMEYISPACGQTILVGVEVEPNGEWQGKPQYKYKLTYPKGSQKPTVQDNPPSEGVPF
ncbi:MAG: hypothetical protein RIR91_1844 [Verrucomicrobiota bacterium]|jgi:hypothetical protein